MSNSASHGDELLRPATAAAFFVLVMLRIAEPGRRAFNAILVAGVGGVYLNGGFGVRELLYPLLGTPVVYRGLWSHRFIGLAWLMHAAWDLPHHLWVTRFGRSCRRRHSVV